MVEKISFGSINDNDESLKSKETSKFGLNQGNITKLEFNPNAGKDGSPSNAVDINFMTNNGKEFWTRIFDITKVFDKSGNQIEDETNPEFIKIYNRNIKQNMGVIIHAVKAVGVTQHNIDNALKIPTDNFVDWAKIVTSLVPDNFEKLPVDVFLEYQWNIPEGFEMTLLTLPKNMKGGKFLCPSVEPVGSWKEERKWKDENGNVVKGLRYIDNNGNIHPFMRNSDYMNSNKAIQQSSKNKEEILDEKIKNEDNDLPFWDE